MCLAFSVVGAFLVIPLVLMLVLVFAPPAHALRCHISSKLQMTLDECVPENDINTNGSFARQIPEFELNVEALTSQESKFVGVANMCMERGADIMDDTRDWHKESGKNLETGRVYSKKFKGIGKVSKMQGYIDASPEEIFQVMITESGIMNTWYTSVEKTERLQQVSDNIDVIHVISGPIAGGLVSQRDYVDVRSWRGIANGTFISLCSTEHPDMPVSKKIIRGTTKQSSTMFQAVEGNPNKSLFQWIVRFEVGGWVPAWAVDNNIAGSMMEFLDLLRARMAVVHRQRNRT